VNFAPAKGAISPAIPRCAIRRLQPTLDLSEAYIDWIRKQSDIRDYFSEASDILKTKALFSPWPDEAASSIPDLTHRSSSMRGRIFPTGRGHTVAKRWSGSGARA